MDSGSGPRPMGPVRGEMMLPASMLLLLLLLVDATDNPRVIWINHDRNNFGHTCSSIGESFREIILFSTESSQNYLLCSVILGENG